MTSIRILGLNTRAAFEIPGRQRGFHTVPSLYKAAVSIVQPIHHRIKFKKNLLKPDVRAVLDIPEWDTRSNSFNPQKIQPDRLEEHLQNTIAPDLLLANFVHKEKLIPGKKRQQWDGSSPYHLNRPTRAPAGSDVETPDIHPRDHTNIPTLEAIWLHTFVQSAREDSERSIIGEMMLQQISGKKGAPVFSKSQIQRWKLKRNTRIGARVKLTGPQMYQFYATLIEIVLPRIKNFQGINNSSGDMFGNVTLGLTPDDVRLFPEIEGSPELWPFVPGLHITILTTAQTDPEARTFLSAIGVPFVGRERFNFVPSLDAPKNPPKRGIVYSS
ncbi:ribosomal protein L5 domain-containing protein [Dipodascopsis uninucleata]